MPVALGAGTLIWVLAPEGGHGRARSGGIVAPARGDDERLAQVAALVRGDRNQTADQLVQLYGDWSHDAAALAARQAALNALFAESNVARRLSLVLAAIEADATPPEEDPLWSHIVESLAAVWKGDTLTRGLDLMLVEQRSRAKRAVISSFAHLATSDRAGELLPPQKQLLTERFIDLYKQLPESQQPEVELGLRNIGGDDQGDILLGKVDSLEINRAFEQNLAETQRAIAEGRSVVPEHAQDGEL